MKPVFILSLPRTGSTLLQRVLTSHDEIASVAEPWILLPWFYAFREYKVSSEFNNRAMSSALADFAKNLPGGRPEFLSEMAQTAMRLYERISGGKYSYFLDKTPRYHLILDDLFAAFPEGKFIFLWRHPLAVAASMLATVQPAGSWKLFFYYIDLYQGVDNLLDAYETYRSRIISVRYEDLIHGGSDAEWKKIFNYLNLDYSPEILESFSQIRFSGGMGDPTGINEYTQLSSDSLNKWRFVFTNPFRKAWCRRYLVWLGEKRLAQMGYDLKSILNELENIPFDTKYFFSDIFWAGYGWAYSLFDFAVLKYKIKRFISGKVLYPHL